ncbi:MAG: GntR family transcriptional regulator [Lentisphaeria bacterium]|nr:GntR family transcriptional regulator [Lentisphaeria bacterium]
MNKQSETVRKYVLENLESGVFQPGARLPGSRKIADHLGISRPVVQSALDTLVNEGLLVSVSRSGLYVDGDWTSRRIRACIKLYTHREFLPWLGMFEKEMASAAPELHISTCCEEGTFEIVTTAVAQTRFREYVDLAPLVKSCFPDLSPFHAEQLRPFMHGERLSALPFLFSPRIVACNRRMLAEAGCSEPGPDWSIRDFADIMTKLRAHFPPERVFPWNTNAYLWMNFVLCFGGRLFCLEKPDPVCFDSPETVRALTFFRSLAAKDAPPSGREDIAHYARFAVSVLDRQLYSPIRRDFDDGFLFLPMPGVSPEHSGRSIQATELFVMRRGSVDRDLCMRIMRFLWSEKFQDHLAELRYGLPIRRSSLERAFLPGNPADAAFRDAMGRLCNEYSVSSPPLFDLVLTGISSIIAGGGEIESRLRELAAGVRVYLKYTKKEF